MKYLVKFHLVDEVKNPYNDSDIEIVESKDVDDAIYSLSALLIERIKEDGGRFMLNNSVVDNKIYLLYCYELTFTEDSIIQEVYEIDNIELAQKGAGL